MGGWVAGGGGGGGRGCLPKSARINLIESY